MPGVFSPGSPVSFRGFLQNGIIHHQIGDHLPEPGVLLLQRLEPLGLIDLESAVLLTPFVIRLIADLELATGLGNALALRQ